MILRYDDIEPVITKLDPFEDVTNWFAGLRSKDLAAGILREAHGFGTTNEIGLSAKAISSHSIQATNLLDQALSGPKEVSFLPLYYALLNVVKICIIVSGQRNLLLLQKYHGVQYNPSGKFSHDLLTEEVELKSKGAIPLFYSSITNEAIPKMKLQMSSIYPYIRSISHEYNSAYRKQSKFIGVNLSIVGDDIAGYRLTASLIDSNRIGGALSRSSVKLLKDFEKVNSNPMTYQTRLVKGNRAEAKKKLYACMRRYLICADLESSKGYSAVTPVTNFRLLVPEELAILLAFFHLSNIVRYNPEYLEKLKDSKSWALLLCLRRQAALSFLELCWSFIRNTQVIICSASGPRAGIIA